MFDTILEKTTKMLEEMEKDSFEKEQYFIDRTNKHIGLVKKAARKIVEAYPEFGELLRKVEVHDASKFKEPERTPYIEITWRRHNE